MDMDFLDDEFGGFVTPNTQPQSQPVTPLQSAHQQQQQQSYPQNNQYPKKEWNNQPKKEWNGGGGNNNWNGQRPRKKKKDDTEVHKVYMPYALYVDVEAPPEIKDKLLVIAEKMYLKGLFVRFNADEKPIWDRFKAIADEEMEDYSRWKKYTDRASGGTIECPERYYNNATSVFNSQRLIPNWDSLPNVVRDQYPRDFRMLTGQKCDNQVKGLIIWTPDGAYKRTQCTKDTGNGSFIIKVADRWKIPVININNPDCREAFTNLFIGEEDEQQ